MEYSFLNTFLGTLGTTANGDFIWAGASASVPSIIPTPSTDTNFISNVSDYVFAHILHPYITSWINETVPNDAAALACRNSVYANQPSGSTAFGLQTPLFFEGASISSTTARWSKIGFESADQYLIGPRSVGAYLFLNPASSTDIRVEGNDSLAFKTVSFGNNNAFNIPVTFQYRMTDFFGDGTVGLGNVGGDLNSNSSTNLSYTKTIGIDIYYNPLNKERFSFDLEISARYFSRALSSKDTPARTFEIAIDDLNNTIRNIAPTLSRDVGSNNNSGGGNVLR
jgi:hypothetical protein